MWYSKIQWDVLNILTNTKNNNQEIDLFIKFYPNDENKPPYNEWLQSFNVRIYANIEPLVNILKNQNFDLIITEACATTLLEVLCTKSQILAFIPSDFIKIFDEDKILLNRRVFIAETKHEYIAMLHKLNNLLENKKPIDDDFLFNYGFCGIEQDPLILTKEAIQSVISK